MGHFVLSMSVRRMPNETYGSYDLYAAPRRPTYSWIMKDGFDLQRPNFPTERRLLFLCFFRNIELSKGVSFVLSVNKYCQVLTSWPTKNIRYWKAYLPLLRWNERAIFLLLVRYKIRKFVFFLFWTSLSHNWIPNLGKFRKFYRTSVANCGTYMKVRFTFHGRCGIIQI